MYWLAPGNFSFFHAFLPIFASLVVFAAWFLLLAFIKKWLLPRNVPDEGRSTFHKMTDNIVCRVVNYVDSIWRYQFISVILICVVQLVAL